MAFQTPQKPLPGAFFNTPAVGRLALQSLSPQQSYQRPSQQSQQLQQVRQPQAQPLGQNAQVQSAQRSQMDQPAPLQSLTPVERAARTINETLQGELRYPDLDTYVKQGVSGDYDVCNGPNDATWAPFQKTKVYDLPDVVFEQTNAANLNTRMGLFAKLNHAWMIIDSAFYMWDYTVPNPPLQGYEDSPYSLKFARICVPRRGVFAPTVTHVLVLASVAEITLIAIGYAADANGIKTLTMYKTGMTTGVQGIGVDAIASSVESGRIFFSGNNELYEIKYQQEERWFWPRCRKINHTRFGVQGVLAIVPRPWTTHAADKVVQIVVDDSRRLLYTLSKQSDIQVWHMDAPNSLVPVITKTRRSTLDDISHMSVSPLLLKDLEFTSIHPISAYEGYRLHLMATTSSGCRLYLSATRGSSYITSSGAPHSMQVQHIRYPPTSDSRGYRMNEQGLDTTSEILCHTRIAARFPPGFFFCFVKKEELGTHDAFFMSAPDTGRIATEAREPRYYETATWLDSLQHTEDVGLITQPFAAARQPLGFGNELAVQFDEPVPEIAVLTNTGVHIIRRRRLVDMFAASIRGIVDEGLDNEIKKFIRQYGRGETTATALAVACGQGSDSGDGRLKMSTPETIEAARKAFVDHGGRPSVDQNLIAESSGQILDNVRPSSRHEGMALYISRLLRSIWKAAVVREGIDQNGAIAVSATISSDKLKSIQDELTKLRSFLHQNKSFIEGLAGPDSLQRVATQNEEYALQGEHQALNSLVRLNESIIEGISFVQVLFEERIDQIWATLDEQVRRYLRDLTYERLFSTTPGKDLAKTLVKAIVHRNIANGSNVDTVADALRRRCGSFCSPDDVVIFKAQEQLQKASEVEGSSDHGRMLLNESLRLFEQVSASLTMQNLRTAVQEFTQLQFYAGAIKLVLLVASQLDRGHTAEAWVSVGKPPDDPRESKYVNRIQCYDLVHNVLTAVDDFTTSQPDTFDGRPSIAALKRNEAYAVVNEAKDELFQNDLYDWYLIQGWTDRLLGVESRYIVPYLDSIASQSADKADLLWKYHVQHEDFYNAAVVQLNLAKGSLEIPLARRVHYLIRAKANASTTNGVYGRQQRQYLLHEISELLDVANIQDELLQRLRGEPRIEAERKQGVVQALDGQIQDLTSLYNGYADQASYYDICLLIYQAANHRDEGNIAATWENFIRTIHERVVNDPNSHTQPFSAVSTDVRTMAGRLAGSEHVFSPNLLIPMFERYSLNYKNSGGIPKTWAVDLCCNIGFSYESMIAELQQLLVDELPPFVGRNKSTLVDHLVYAINLWYEDCMRSNQRLFGGIEQAHEIIAFLAELEGVTGVSVQDKEVIMGLRRKIEDNLG